MPANSLNLNSQSLADHAVISSPLTVTPETLIEDAIARMHQTQASYVLIVDQQRPIGIFTERDLVQLLASGQPTEGRTIVAVMTTGIRTISVNQVSEPLTLFELMCQYQVRHLPIVDEEGRLSGILTQKSLRQSLISRHRELEKSQVHLNGQLEAKQV